MNKEAFFSAVALALMMGLPLGVLLLGTLAGWYLGRRASRGGDARWLPWGLGSITAVAAAAVAASGVLAIPDALQLLFGAVGLDRLVDTGRERTAIAALGVVAVACAQYALARWASRRGGQVRHND